MTMWPLAPYLKGRMSVLLLQLAVAVVGTFGAHELPLVGTLDGHRLSIEIANGPSCEAELKRTDGWGMAALVCSNGSSGTIGYHLVDGSGTAYGTLDGEHLSLAIG